MKNWKFEQNSFETQTRGSNRKMISIGTVTNDRLAAKLPDPVFQAIFDDYHPVYQDYRDTMGDLTQTKSQRKGDTKNVKTELGRLKERLPVWQGKVYDIYPVGSPTALQFFPDDKNPFYHGTYEERIDAVKNLRDRMAADANPTLVPYAPVVTSFYNSLQLARQTQQHDEGEVEGIATLRENQRKLLADA